MTSKILLKNPCVLFHQAIEKNYNLYNVHNGRLDTQNKGGKEDDGWEGYNNGADGISSSYRIFSVMASTYNRKKKRKIINEDQGTRRELEQDVELIEKMTRFNEKVMTSIIDSLFS